MAPGTVKLRESLQQSWRIYLVLRIDWPKSSPSPSLRRCWPGIVGRNRRNGPLIVTRPSLGVRAKLATPKR